MAKKTKKEWIEWFNSLDDNVEIEFKVWYGEENKEGKLKKLTINLL